ncbi:MULTISPECIES: hypothetical protein [unclassified Microbulbifer]|uniref:hypothetical protein n=1 Tax=unclassified Microbulbifer TaxID=2619833 RepID=UPI0027E4CB1F|nr:MULTISPECIES: hypothetical protein [unclassified Microbulbifer]
MRFAQKAFRLPQLATLCLPQMNILVTIFRVFCLLALGALSVKMMFGDPVGKSTETIFSEVIVYAECPTGKYARPFIKVKGNETRFHVIKEFAYRTGCFDEQESLLIGELASFVYFKDAPSSGKVIEITVSGKKIYERSEFVGKSTSAGALLFMLAVGLAAWFSFSVKRLSKSLN